MAETPTFQNLLGESIFRASAEESEALGSVNFFSKASSKSCFLNNWRRVSFGSEPSGLAPFTWAAMLSGVKNRLAQLTLNPRINRRTP